MNIKLKICFCKLNCIRSHSDMFADKTYKCVCTSCWMHQSQSKKCFCKFDCVTFHTNILAEHNYVHFISKSGLHSVSFLFSESHYLIT